jgi:hypothetical protein
LVRRVLDARVEVDAGEEVDDFLYLRAGGSDYSDFLKYLFYEFFF